jgi:hypothetical protein
VIIEGLIFVISIVGYLMANRGFLRNILGDCAPYCPPGAYCDPAIYFCSEAYGSLIFFASGTLLILYLLAFAIYKATHRQSKL